MRIGYISDIHNEFGTRSIPVPKGIDVLCIAGDVDTNPKNARKVLESLRAQTDAPILYVLGNHEYYGHLYPNAAHKYKDQISKIKDAWILDRGVKVIDGVRFLGTTLWSDLSNPIHALRVEQGMNDFHKILIKRESGKIDRLRATDYTREFKASRDWLSSRMTDNWSGKNVIITHHSPSPITCAPQFANDTFRFGYHSNLDNFIFETQPELWIYGHDHISASHKLGRTKLVSNQLGYPQERQEPIIAVVEI